MAAYFQQVPFTVEEYRIKLALILAALIRCCEDLEIPGAEIFSSGMDPFAEIARLTSLDAVRLWFTGLTERIACYTQTRQENFAQVKVREALEYLESRYADPSLSLQSLCKKLDISMSYFSANRCLSPWKNSTNRRTRNCFSSLWNRFPRERSREARRFEGAVTKQRSRRSVISTPAR
ncbi:MAG: hypothetical protein LBJ24_07495 [Treponema sp.]|nr:hypothetical protein [Treponema sp.]